jgi:hypothetical protein
MLSLDAASGLESEPGLELGDVILPAQYYAPLHKARFTLGEHRLMLAILIDAINCILACRRQVQLRQEALEWITGRTGGAVSFVNACEAIGVEPNALRTAVEKLARNENKRKAALKLLTRRDAHDRTFFLSRYNKELTRR